MSFDNMNVEAFLSKALQKLRRPVFRFIRRDEITFHKITFRDDLRQIGTDYGGWVVPFRLLNRNPVCYCVGCGEDISFDLGLIDEFGCHVYGFDPTPRAIKYVREHAKQYDKYHFSDFGIWDKEDILIFYAPRNPEHVSHSILNLQKTEDYFEAKVERLSSVMQRNGHDKLDLLKLDIEGAEYQVIDSIIEDKLNIMILCVEYDERYNPLDNKYKERIKESVNKLVNFGYSL
jgi:FkbM family methyltransferase